MLPGKERERGSGEREGGRKAVFRPTWEQREIRAREIGSETLCLNKESETCGCQKSSQVPMFSFPLCILDHSSSCAFQDVEKKVRGRTQQGGNFGKSLALESHSWIDTLAPASPSVPQERRCLLEAEGEAGGTGSVRLNLLQEHQGHQNPGGDLGGQCPQGHQVVTIWAEAAQGRVWSTDSATSLPGVKSPYRSKLPDLG